MNAARPPRRRLVLAALAGWAWGGAGAQQGARQAQDVDMAQETAQDIAAPRRRSGAEFPFVRFAGLPVGGAVEWRRHWDVLLAALGAELQRPVSSLPVTGEEALARILAREQIDVAFLGGRLALDAVTGRRLRVVAQMACEPDQAPRALLLAGPAAGPPAGLEALLAEAARWRLARGDVRSLSSFIVPQAQLLLPRGLPMETAFRDERVGRHQDNLLALANGDVDLATASSLHLASFAQQFPAEAARLRVVWRSAPLPPPLLLVSESAQAAWKARVRDFFLRVGGPEGAPPWRAALAALQMPDGFGAADNRALLPVAQLVADLGRERAAAGRWVNEAARQARLDRLAREHAQRQALLRAPVEAGP